MFAIVCKAGTHFALASAFEQADISIDTDRAPTRLHAGLGLLDDLEAAIHHVRINA